MEWLKNTKIQEVEGHRQDRQETHLIRVDLNQNISLRSNVNGINAPIKR